MSPPLIWTVSKELLHPRYDENQFARLRTRNGYLKVTIVWRSCFHIVYANTNATATLFYDIRKIYFELLLRHEDKGLSIF